MTSIPTSHADLLEGQIATLATVGADGRPQVTPVWFLAEDGTVRISLNGTRQKTKNLRRNPAVTVLLLDLANPCRYLELRGDAEIVDDEDRAFAERVGAKYQSDLRAHDGPGEGRVIVTIKPT